MSSTAKIISYNLYGERICAGAAKISTTKGNAFEVFENSQDSKKNRELIQKVLDSGHQSILEHAVFTIALWDVSAFVEQFFIEHRLASFTVKSRRYVDFGSLGYYIPPDLEGRDLERYCQYMDILFDAYRYMLEREVPREDARFLLPYSFHSNFYCTVNGRELAHIIDGMRHGRGREVPELEDLAAQLEDQAAQSFPWLLPALEDGRNMPDEDPARVPWPLKEKISFADREEAGVVRLVQTPVRPEAALEAACRISRPGLRQRLDVEELLKSARPRELEQLSYAFVIDGITLSGITHIVRHRMQSIIVPPIQCAGSRYILPDSVKKDPVLLKSYKEAVLKARAILEEGEGRLGKYACYFALSGSLLDIMTTMNGRELLKFIQLRTCNRAQWEIRDISIRLLKRLRADLPQVFGHFGPTCFMEGRCPEGRLSCGRKAETAVQFKDL